MNKLIKPLFDIQRVHVDGAKLYYELWYRHGTGLKPIVDACFFSMTAAAEYRDNLLESLE